MHQLILPTVINIYDSSTEAFLDAMPYQYIKLAIAISHGEEDNSDFSLENFVMFGRKAFGNLHKHLHCSVSAASYLTSGADCFISHSVL